ncbi:MAG TPA: ribosome maturation factor RimM [Candidatus Dormibacteraeota bacterium]|nr:ribosome maturation factor RimM [Candidatus Dormibacteraeota bacterium]
MIRGAHGVRGEVRVAPDTDNPARFVVGRVVEVEGLGERAIRSVRGVKGELIVALEGVEDRDAAERLRGRELRVPIEDARSETPGYLWADLVGMDVVDESGNALGVLVEVLRPGGDNDVFVVRTADDRELLLPAIDSVVLAIDVAGRRMVVRPQDED